MKRSWKLWLLIVFFFWVAVKTGSSIYRPEQVADFTLLSSLGFGVMFYMLNIPIAAMELATAYLLFSKKAKAFVFGYIACALEVFNGIIVTVVSMMNSDKLKEIYVAIREARGIPAKAQDFGFLMTPMGMASMLFIYILFYIAIILALKKVKKELVR